MDPGTIIAVIDLSAKALSHIAEYYHSVSHAKTDILRLKDEVEHYRFVLLQLQRLNESADATRLPVLDYLAVALAESTSDLEKLNRMLEPKKGHENMKKFGWRAIQWPLSKADITRFLTDLERRRGILSLALSTYQTSMMHSVKRNQNLGEQDQHLDKLPYAKGAAFDDNEREHKAQCTNGTRVDLLTRVQQWSDKRERRIFWLSGMAGTGKSTIAQTVAKAFADQNCLGASFFFARGEGETGHASQFISTIARQLAETFPPFRQHLCHAISSHPRILRQGLRNQWNELILRPLSKLPGPCPHWNIVVDALDECNNEDNIRLILQLFMELKDSTDIKMYIFVTSRPETCIRLRFKEMPDIVYDDLALHDIPRCLVEKDIALFLQKELQSIRKEHSMPENWPEQSQLDLLVQKSDGLFIFIATACRFLQDVDWNPEERLLVILQEGFGSLSPLTTLDKMYTQVLRYSVAKDRDGKEKEDLCRRFREIIGPIVVMFDSLSVTALAGLLSIPTKQVELALNSLHSLLSVPQSPNYPLRLLHPSFRDYLLDPSRCLDQDFIIDEQITHMKIARSCLHILRKSLKKDICNLKIPGTSVSDLDPDIVQSQIPKQVQYACRYWVDHFQRMSVAGRRQVGLRDNGEVHFFLKENFLQWLEVLGLIGTTSEGVLMLNELASMVEKLDEPAIRDILSDARRFFLSYKSIIAEAPLQIYVSSLLFSPRKSQIRSCYIDELPSWVQNLPLVDEDWSPCTQILESDWANEVVFSHDDKLLASASREGTVRVWDPETGTCIYALEGHSSWVNTVAFSDDGYFLASASSDRSIRLWEPKTGAFIQEFTGHSDTVYLVKFSRDSQLLASASTDNTVRLWHLKTGVCTQVLEGYWNSMEDAPFPRDYQRIAFSREGYLASVSRDKAVRLWDTQTGFCVQTLDGHLDYVNAVVFSPNDKLLASTSRDRTVRLWDLKSGSCIYTLEGHSRLVRAVAFSYNSHTLASASCDGIVRLWDLETGTLTQTLKGHTDGIDMIAFSRDRQLLASASRDRTVRLWELKTSSCVQTLKGHSRWVNAIAFSRNSLILASASADGVRLWDPKIIANTQTLEGHSHYVNAVTFSQSGQILASASHDHTVRLWDPKTGACAKILKGHIDWVRAIAFSHDQRHLASASQDKTIRLWNLKTGDCSHTLEGHTKWIKALTFSNDDRLLASASHDMMVRLWDTETGVCIQMLGHTHWVDNVAFSSDDQLLAVALGDHTIGVWDLKIGARTQIFKGHSKYVTSIAFSPNDQLVASASEDMTVRLWDPKSGHCTRVVEKVNEVSGLSFPLDVGFISTNRGTPHIKATLNIPSLSSSGKSWTIWQEWLLCDGRRALWLPPDFRSAVCDNWEALFAIARPTGQIAFVGLSYGYSLD